MQVSEVLQVQRELNRVTGELERVKGQMEYLSKNAAMSTITVMISW